MFVYIRKIRLAAAKVLHEVVAVCPELEVNYNFLIDL